MLTGAVTFLLIAIFVGIFGFIAVGPAAMIVSAVFFALFLWSIIRERGKD